MNIRASLLALAATSLVVSSANAEQSGGGSVSRTIHFANGTNACVNVARNEVSLWITSIRTEKKDGLFSSTDAIGAEADLTMTSSISVEPAKFAMAKDINVKDIDGKIIRAGLAFSVLPNYRFDPEAKITKIDVPVIFLRTKGD